MFRAGADVEVIGAVRAVEIMGSLLMIGNVPTYVSRVIMSPYWQHRDKAQWGNMTLRIIRVQGAGCRVQGAGCRVQGSTLDAVYVYVVPWSEFPIVPSYPHYPVGYTDDHI